MLGLLVIGSISVITNTGTLTPDPLVKHHSVATVTTIGYLPTETQRTVLQGGKFVLVPVANIEEVIGFITSTNKAGKVTWSKFRPSTNDTAMFLKMLRTANK